MGFSTYLRDRWRSLLLALGLLTVFLTVLLLFQLPLVAVGYAAVLCGTIYLGAGIWDLTRWHARHHRLQNLEQEVLSTLDNPLPPWRRTISSFCAAFSRPKPPRRRKAPAASRT